MGQTILSVTGMEKGSEEVRFVMSDGSAYRMYHRQDCCESVDLEDVVGDPVDLIGSPLIQAKVAENSDDPAVQPDWAQNRDEPYEPDSYTWTYYKFATIKGSVTLRWYGESNGYYSEGVDFEKVA